jgi:hypothetical protein
MSLLRRVLYWHAVVWTGCGVAIAVAPRWVLVSLFDQPVYPQYGYVRVCGVMSVGLALFMVLIAQRIEELWWWSWAFALVDVAIIATTALTAILCNSPALLWWLFAGVTALLFAGVIAGLARAGQEKPLV